MTTLKLIKLLGTLKYYEPYHPIKGITNVQYTLRSILELKWVWPCDFCSWKVWASWKDLILPLIGYLTYNIRKYLFNEFHLREQLKLVAEKSWKYFLTNFKWYIFTKNFFLSVFLPSNIVFLYKNALLCIFSYGVFFSLYLLTFSVFFCRIVATSL